MSRLPDSVQQIADVIGEAAALELVRRWPRTKTNGDIPFRPIMYVPAKLTPEHRLVAILGWQNAARLVRVFPGDLIFLATCAITLRDDRNDVIASMIARKVSVASVSIKLGMSERHVRRIVTKMRADKAAMERARTRKDHSYITAATAA